VAVALNLREPELTKIYREYWKLKRLDALNSIYEETNDKLCYFGVDILKPLGEKLPNRCSAFDIAESITVPSLL
jgi:hypothetical protein